MRLVLSAFLLGILALPWLGTRAWISYEQDSLKRSLKYRMMNEASDDQLYSIRIAIRDIHTELAWEHSKEFEYHGSMYDVVRYSIDGDSITYICWWDSEESQLEQTLHDILAYGTHKMPVENEAVTALFNLLKQAFLQHSVIAYWSYHKLRRVRCYARNILSSQTFPGVLVPPPQA